MSPDDAASTKRMIEGPPLLASISVPLSDQQRLCSPSKKAVQQPFRYCEFSSRLPMHSPVSLSYTKPLFPPPEPSLPSPWRKDCTRQRRQMMRLCSSASATGTLACHRATFVCGSPCEWRAFLHAACNVLAADRPSDPWLFQCELRNTLSQSSPSKTTSRST